MTYQQLLYFYYSAKTLSFSKAASLCFVAQTAVSKQIQNLESELGCMLFRRVSGKQLELTPAGDNLKAYAEHIIRLWNDSLESTKRIGGTNFEKTAMNIGYWGCIESKNMTYIFDDFLHSEPNCHLFYTHLSLNGIMRCLENDTVDMVIAPQVHMETFPGVKCHPLLESPFGVILHKDNPLCQKQKIYPADLIGETFIQRIVTASFGLCNSRQKVWEHLGFYPQKLIEVNEYKSAVLMISNNQGISISPEYVEERDGVNIEFRPIEGLTEKETIAIGWLERNEKPVLKRFVSSL